jgi:hypothetical protein
LPAERVVQTFPVAGRCKKRKVSFCFSSHAG